MNWSFILLQIVVFMGLISFMIAAIYYVRHRHSKAMSIKQAMEAKDEDDGGVFLKRYIPPEHRTDPLKKVNTSLFASKPLFYMACTMIPALFLGFIGFNYYANRSDFLADINLEGSDIEALSTQAHTFTTTVGSYAPSFNYAVSNIDKSKTFVVFRKRTGNSYEAEQWTNYLKENKIRTKTCFYGRLKSCKLNQASIAILSLEFADKAIVDRLLASKASLWTYGFPSNIDADSGPLPNLSFSQGAMNDVTELALVGDKELTLGVDAGTHFPIARSQKNIFVSSGNPQAIAMFSDGKAGGERNVRMHTGTSGDSRIVWMDFSMSQIDYLDPELKSQFDPVTANIIRFLTKQNYATIATWPMGKKYAAFIEQDTEDGYKNSSKVAKFFKANNYPVTWYSLSDLVKKYRGVSHQIADAGEMACHGDNHDIFTRYSLEDQVARLARCIKVIEAVTGQRALGFRPPTEAHNTNTLSAVLNVGMTHVFAESWTRSLVPHLKVSDQTGKSLVSLPRAITDDYYLWPTLKLNKEQSVERMMDELEWIRMTGTLYGFSFHTQFMLHKDNFEVVKTIAHAVNRDGNSWVATAGDISEWWRTRHNLIVGNPVSPDTYARYKPVMLQVGNSGQVSRMGSETTVATHEQE